MVKFDLMYGMGRYRVEVGLAFANFVVIGIGGGAAGVLLPAQIGDYGIDKAVVGLLFFAFSAGYLTAGAASGWLMRRLGLRGEMVLGAAVSSAAAFGCGIRPSFAALFAVTVVFGFGGGVIESALNAYLAALPRPVVLLNLLHACYGVGALAGPLLATRLLAGGLPWGSVYLLIGSAAAVLTVGFALRYPGRLPDTEPEPRTATSTSTATTTSNSNFGAALRHPAVLMSGLFLAVYVGVEISIGNWLYSLLVEDRGQGALLAGWVVSAYWMGFTLGRFVLSVLAERFGIGPEALGWGCLAVVMVAGVAVWLVPGVVAASAGLVVLGFALGPIYPLTVAVLPMMTPSRLVPTAIGMLVGMSVLGGGLFPWVAGTLAQLVGIGTLLPFTLLLGVVLLVTWWWLARRLAEPKPSLG
jgi:fucose permease